MLKINPDPTFTVDVEITIPGQNKAGTLPITFNYKDRDQLKDFLGRVRATEIDGKQAVAEIVKTWEWPEYEYTPENLAQFLNNYPAADVDIVACYRRMSFDSRVKN